VSDYSPFRNRTHTRRITIGGTKPLYTFDRHIINKNQLLPHRLIAMRFFNIHNVLIFLPGESMMQKLSDGADYQLIRRRLIRDVISAAGQIPYQAVRI